MTTFNFIKKNFSYLVIAALVLTSTFGMLKAQTQKLGHINSMELMQMMPGVKEANESLEKYQNTNLTFTNLFS